MNTKQMRTSLCDLSRAILTQVDTKQRERGDSLHIIATRTHCCSTGPEKRKPVRLLLRKDARLQDS